MQDMSDKQHSEAMLRQRAAEEEKAAEKRARNEAGDMRARVQAEIEKQRVRMAVAQREQQMGGGDDMNGYENGYEQHQHQQQPTMRGGQNQQTERIGARVLRPQSYGSSDYFEARLGSEKNPHKAKLDEMRERRWATEQLRSAGGENSRPPHGGNGGNGGNAQAVQSHKPAGGRHFSHGGGKTSGDFLAWGNS